MDTNVILAILALFLTLVSFGVTIWVVFLNNKLNKRLNEAKEHEEKHKEIDTTLGVHTTEISFNRHEILNMQTENQYKSLTADKTLIEMTQIKCLLRAMCTKLDIPSSDYITEIK